MGLLKKRGRASEKMQLHTLRARGVLTGAVVVVAAIVLASAVFAVSVNFYYYSSMRSKLAIRAESAADDISTYALAAGGGYGTLFKSYAEGYPLRDRLELQFLDAEGRVLSSSRALSGLEAQGAADVSRALEIGSTACERFKAAYTREPLMAVSVPLKAADSGTVYLLRLVTSLSPVRKMIFSRCLEALLIGLGVMLVVTGANYFFLSTVSQPIRSLTAMARRIAGGSYGTRLEKRYNDEVGELTDAINDMSQKLSQSEKMQTEFISSVSHELRTPLTAITGWSETMAYDEAIQGDSRRGLEIIRREAGRLTKMVEDLLEFTRIQDGRFTLQVDTLNLPELVEDTLYTYSELFKQAGVTVKYDPPEEDFPDIPGDPARLSQVFLNLLDNACKYGHKGKVIEVSLKMTKEAQAVSVRDHGPGIPPEELPLVKNKFYKGSSKERGNGIGLAVCEEIVSRHNGRLMIYNAEGGGLLVTVTLPAQTTKA